MRVTQGTFSFLPDFTDEQIHEQVQYCIDNGWALSIEHTDDPHPRNTYWEMWGHPMFDNPDAAAVVYELNECRKVYGSRYIKIIAFDSSPGWESIRLSFIPFTRDTLSSSNLKGGDNFKKVLNSPISF